MWLLRLCFEGGWWVGEVRVDVVMMVRLELLGWWVVWLGSGLVLGSHPEVWMKRGWHGIC